MVILAEQLARKVLRRGLCEERGETHGVVVDVDLERREHGQRFGAAGGRVGGWRRRGGGERAVGGDVGLGGEDAGELALRDGAQGFDDEHHVLRIEVGTAGRLFHGEEDGEERQVPLGFRL